MHGRQLTSGTPSGATCLDAARSAYAAFIDRCHAGDGHFRLTPAAEPSAYARCFGVFGWYLLGAHEKLRDHRASLTQALRADIRARRAECDDVPRTKAYRQLLTFTLSALACLGTLDDDPLAELVEEQIPTDLEGELRALGALDGVAGSGNQAMFLAIFLLHARDVLGRDVASALDAWVDLHLESMNGLGFWGRSGRVSHLQFQNGYHQYEILDYLGIANPLGAAARRTVASLADPLGHFAPYPGGGGCFDYDAVHVLTPEGEASDAPDERALLERTARTLLAEQRPDGGFCESLRVRPRWRGLPGFAERLASAAGRPALLRERGRYALTLQRPKHDRIHTHWSRYQRRWWESNLWDSWFRMLTLARIERALRPEATFPWGFIDYPGIGWHPDANARHEGQ